MGIPIQNTYVYSLNFADDQVLLAQDHDDMEYMVRKLKEEYEKWGLAINLEKSKYTVRLLSFRTGIIKSICVKEMTYIPSNCTH